MVWILFDRGCLIFNEHLLCLQITQSMENCINAIAKFSGIICECCGNRKTENCLLCPFGVMQGIVDSRQRDTLLFCNLVEFEFSFLRAGFRRRIFPLMEKASVALTEHRWDLWIGWWISPLHLGYIICGYIILSTKHSNAGDVMGVKAKSVF